MKNKRLFIMLLLLFVLLHLTGCQLAKTELSGERAEKDRLIGVYVTTEHLDLFDDEAYLNDHINTILEGKAPKYTDMEKYSGRLYASLADRVLTNENTGNTVTRQEYVFEGVEGFSFFAPTLTDANTGEQYVSTGADDAISNSHVAVKSGDAEEYHLTGTIYLNPDRGDGVCYLNPVYQSDDGRVYAVQGHGYSLSGIQAEGPNIKTTLSEESTVTVDGEQRSFRTTVELSVEIMYTPVGVCIVELNAQDEIAARHDYTPGKLPETIVLQDDTAYVVVHTDKTDRSGASVRTTMLYDQSCDGFDTFYCRDDGVCAERYTALEWSSEK